MKREDRHYRLGNAAIPHAPAVLTECQFMNAGTRRPLLIGRKVKTGIGTGEVAVCWDGSVRVRTRKRLRHGVPLYVGPGYAGWGQYTTRGLWCGAVPQ